MPTRVTLRLFYPPRQRKKSLQTAWSTCIWKIVMQMDATCGDRLKTAGGKVHSKHGYVKLQRWPGLSRTHKRDRQEFGHSEDLDHRLPQMVQIGDVAINAYRWRYSERGHSTSTCGKYRKRCNKVLCTLSRFASLLIVSDFRGDLVCE